MILNEKLIEHNPPQHLNVDLNTIPPRSWRCKFSGLVSNVLENLNTFQSYFSWSLSQTTLLVQSQKQKHQNNVWNLKYHRITMYKPITSYPYRY